MEKRYSGVGKQLEVEEQEFALKLGNVGESVKSAYHVLLLDEQIRLARENGDKPIQVPVETKNRLLELAEDGRDRQSAQKALHMERSFEAHTVNGRPPIGGAVDD